MNKRIIWILSIIVAASVLTGCKKFLDVEEPIDQVENSKIFIDDSTAASAVVGLYSELMRRNLHFSNGGLSIYCGLSADEFVNTSSSASTDQFTSNSLLSNNTIVSANFWSSAYSRIYHANAILEGLAVSGITDSLKRQLEGEARTIRALCYFYLVNLFGPVPLITTTKYAENESMPRTSVVKVYESIIADLEEAEVRLKPAYPTAGKVRINKWAAMALLARVYLFQNNWAKAKEKSAAVINSGAYSMPAPQNVFLAGSTETIWQMLTVPSFNNTVEGSQFIPPATATTKPAFVLTDTLRKSMDTADRRKVWVGTRVISQVSYAYPAKYLQRTNGGSLENNIVLRLAEQYLIRAEANVQLNLINDAQNDLHVVRQRAGLSKILTTNLDSLRRAIEQERRIEFFAEWGHRWMDLKRTDKADAILKIIKGASWQPEDVLYPIPLPEIERNPFLIQNPGYN